MIVAILILVVHLICALLLLIRLSSRLKGRKEYWIPILMVPIFGPFLGFTIEVMFLLENPGTHPFELETIKHSQDIFWSRFVHTEKEEDVIPLEEAILMNDIKTRRAAVLKTFQDDSLRYLDVLMVARHNEDVDTTHYATIQISKIQRQFQLDLQKYSREHEQNPKNDELLDEYIKLLEKYLDSSLPEENVLRHQRHVFAKLLDEKLAFKPNDRQILIRKLRNMIELKEDDETVFELIAVLKQNWPEDEQVWIEALRACVEWKDQARCQATIDEIQHTRILWTRRGREQVQSWVQVT